MIENLQTRLDAAEVFEYGIVDPKEVEYSEEIRGMCEVNTCQKYGTTWACPPAIGTVEECATRAKKYNKMLVFSKKYELEDSFDFEGMEEGMNDFKKVVGRIDDDICTDLEDYLLLGNEGCGKCKECTYPEPCRFPDKVHGAIEGYGIFVTKLAQQAGIKYNNGVNTLTFFGALLYNE